ncbi:hypothetical protein NST17_19990 [Caldifermentibacillus hisashii]|uniref:Uncharacterized protein n=1 Tax=Caldifermentibacillus hisashii TaxID=996558 RepID=A0ABU9K2T3_9BACI
MAISPTKKQYEEALKIVKEYENRQKILASLNKQLGEKLKEFTHVKFNINKKNKTVEFAGLYTKENRLVTGKATCSPFDIFEDVIGKLIAVKTALNEDIADVVKYVETRTETTFYINYHEYHHSHKILH